MLYFWESKGDLPSEASSSVVPPMLNQVLSVSDTALAFQDDISYIPRHHNQRTEFHILHNFYRVSQSEVVGMGILC